MTKAYDVKVIGWSQISEDFPTQWKAYCQARDAMVKAIQDVHPDAPISWPRGSYGKTRVPTNGSTKVGSIDLATIDPKLLASLAALLQQQATKTVSKTVKRTK